MQINSRIKKNREQRKVSEQFTVSSDTAIWQKLIGSTVQISRVQYKTRVERKNGVTSGPGLMQAIQTDQTPWQYGREGESTVTTEDVMYAGSVLFFCILKILLKTYDFLFQFKITPF